MRLCELFIGLLAATAACAANNVSQIPDLSQLPTCGLACITTTAPLAGCGLLDIDCQCSNQKMKDLTTQCALSNCTLEDSFKLLKAQVVICQYPHESRRSYLRNVLIAFGAMNKVVLSLRLIVRLLSQGTFGADDWLIVLATVADTIAFYVVLRVTDRGFGEHVWNVDMASLEDILLWYYILLILYIFTNAIIKLSILTFYIRIFTGRRFHLICWLTIGFGIAFMITFICVCIFQCTPVSNGWHIVPIGGHCIDLNAATWTYSAINVMQDIAVLVIPLAEVWALKMSFRKKVSVMFVFALGGFGTIASIIRLAAIQHFGRTSDPTWDNVPATMWSAIELGVGMLCSSIPAIYSGLRTVYPSFLSFTSKYISMDMSAPAPESYNMQSKISEIPPGVPYQRTISAFNEPHSNTSSTTTIIIQGKERP